MAIAIPTLIFYTYFAKRVEAMAVEMESLMADLLSKCYRKGVAMPSVSSGYVEGQDVPPTLPSATYVPQTRRLAMAPVTQASTEPESEIQPS